MIDFLARWFACSGRFVGCGVGIGTGLLGATACQHRLAPPAYVAAANRSCRPVCVGMDQALHLTPACAFLDSAALVYRVTETLQACPRARLHIVVHFTGAGSWDYRRARAAGLMLKELLVAHGYAEARIDYDAKIWATAPARRYPYRRVDFQAVYPARSAQP